MSYIETSIIQIEISDSYKIRANSTITRTSAAIRPLANLAKFAMSSNFYGCMKTCHFITVSICSPNRTSLFSILLKNSVPQKVTDTVFI